LDVSKSSALTELYCGDNQFAFVIVNDDQLGDRFEILKMDDEVDLILGFNNYKLTRRKGVQKFPIFNIVLEYFNKLKFNSLK